MRYFGRVHRDRWAMLAAVVLPLAMATVLLPWRSSLANTDVALLLVVTIVAVAANGHRAAGALAAVSAAVWFDFFWTKPYQQFAITRGTDIATAVLLLVVGIAVSELAVRGRRARRTVVFDTAYLSELRSTVRLVAEGRDPQEVARHVQAELVALLGLRDVRFERGQLLGHPPRLEADGTLAWGDTRWDIDEHGFPNQDVELRTGARGTVFGRFMMTPVPGTAPSRQAREVAGMLAAQVGISFAQQEPSLRSRPPAHA
ncbi:hypothetical protein ABH926_006055 [Catenulispora sp. GP43]|uniref:DUF4118 domain-containing protein n=1 Tax=Catenulispora sp. GP43 TaxID=3156263 RepID=UPI003513A70B